MPSPQPSDAPEPFCTALAELVQIGMSVARMLGRAAEAEAALADAATTAQIASDVPPLANSLAEAIAADQASAAAGEARRAVITRTATVAAAFNQTARAIRRTILLAERLDRGWARPIGGDNRQAMTCRQIARAVTDAIARHADGDYPKRLDEARAERLDALDTLDDVTSRPAEDIIRDICRDLGLDPARMPPNPAGERSAPPPLQPSGAPTRTQASPPKEHPA